MTPAQLLRILYARRKTIVAALAATLVLALAVVLVVPKRYVATASVVVNGRGDDPLRAASSGTSGGPSVTTQVDIIKRTRVAQRVVADLGLARDDGWRAAWQDATDGRGDEAAWISTAIASGLAVVSGTESNVVDLQYKSEDPQRAATMANAFADAYLETMLELRTVPAGQYAGFFDERIRAGRERLEAAQGRLSSFEKSNDLVGGPGKVDAENTRLGELSTQLAVAQAQAADSSSRQHAAAAGAGSSPDVLQYPVVQDLRTKIAAQEVKLKELSSRVTPEYPAYKSATIELDELKSRLAFETNQVAGSLATSERVGSSRVAELRRAVDEQRQHVLSMQALRDKDDVLRKEAESAQANFDLLMQRQSQSSLESLARQSDAALLDRATAPLKPSSPRVVLIFLLAVVGGVLLGALIALAWEYFHPMLRSVDDLVECTGLPVLATVPDARRRSWRAGRLGSTLRPALTQ